VDRIAYDKTAFEVVRGIQFNENREISASFRADPSVDLEEKAAPILDGTAIVVSATVGERREKLVDEIAMG
jgi:hypothetical protein